MTEKREEKERHKSANEAIAGKYPYKAHKRSTAPYGIEEHQNEEQTKRKAQEPQPDD